MFSGGVLEEAGKLLLRRELQENGALEDLVVFLREGTKGFVVAFFEVTGGLEVVGIDSEFMAGEFSGEGGADLPGLEIERDEGISQGGSFGKLDEKSGGVFFEGEPALAGALGFP